VSLDKLTVGFHDARDFAQFPITIADVARQANVRVQPELGFAAGLGDVDVDRFTRRSFV
jgi:hypothetical protein